MLQQVSRPEHGWPFSGNRSTTFRTKRITQVGCVGGAGAPELAPVPLFTIFQKSLSSSDPLPENGISENLHAENCPPSCTLARSPASHAGNCCDPPCGVERGTFPPSFICAID